ncbi:MAG TPA: hypothetical protein P5079_07130 [Elusimicrobiota bacterium]|nr:hypothetical protein [Elusimicrobiota bacterium]
MSHRGLSTFVISVVLFLGNSFVSAQENASWMRTQTLSNALNPNISVIGDFVGTAGPRESEGSNRFALREAELGFQANVDPYARADVFAGWHEGEALELEEAYVTLLALPLALQARGGKFRANFGRLNMIHPHELPQVDQPLVLERYLGGDGLNSAGFEVSRVFGPFGLFTEFSYAVLNDLGGAHEHGEEAGQTVFVNARDGNGNLIVDGNGTPVEIPVTVREEEEPVKRSVRNFAHVGRVRFYRDMTDTANVELGLSGVLHQPEGHEQRRMAGADVTFRWKPLRRGLYRSFLWRTEGVYSTRKLEAVSDLSGAVTAPEMEVDRRGFYSYVELQPARRWRFGLRGDYVEDPEAKDEVLRKADGTTFQVSRSITRAISPVVTFTLSEFNRFRAQYQCKRLPDRETENIGYLQWTTILGPHGAHPF